MKEETISYTYRTNAMKIPQCENGMIKRWSSQKIAREHAELNNGVEVISLDERFNVLDVWPIAQKRNACLAYGVSVD